MAKARGLNLLSVREVQTLGEGNHSDGGGLTLRVINGSASWVLRYTSPTGKRREMGLGVAARNNAMSAGQSLRYARDLAHSARVKIQDGIDPIDDRSRVREQARIEAADRKAQTKREALTLARACRAYHERVIEPNRTFKHGRQWIASLENHVPGNLWHKSIAEISAPELLDFVLTLYGKMPETAMRIRQRLETVFEDCIFRGHCSANPAAGIRRKLREGRNRRERGAHAALAYAEAPAFMKRLRDATGVAARCLEFTVLTAARTSEAILAQWSEFDLAGGVWTVPPERMKGKEEHRVFLSSRAIEILNAQRGLDERFVFPSVEGKALSNMAMLTVLRRLGFNGETTVHGLARSTFSTWANETGTARPDVIEACLAHREGDRIRAAYNRAQFTAERRIILAAWADFLDGKQLTTNVIPMQQRAA